MLVINTVNAYSFNTAQKNALFADALLRGDVLISDGISVVKACRWLKAKSCLKERIAGWQKRIMIPLLQLSIRQIHIYYELE